MLIAVFVPIAFFPGTTGRLYAQFAITIAFAVALSAFNALTLTPALAALLLDRQHHGKNRFFKYFERGITGGTNGYIHFLKRGMRSRWALVLVFFAALGLTYWVTTRVPRAFVPGSVTASSCHPGLSHLTASPPPPGPHPRAAPPTLHRR